MELKLLGSVSTADQVLLKTCLKTGSCVPDVRLSVNKQRVSAAVMESRVMAARCQSDLALGEQKPADLCVFWTRRGHGPSLRGAVSALRLLSRWGVEFPSISPPDCGPKQSHARVQSEDSVGGGVLFHVWT